jgi:protein-tyrosine phosphatase
MRQSIPTAAPQSASRGLPRRAWRWLPPALRDAARVAVSSRERANARYEWRRRWRGEPALDPAAIRRVVVICHGNICRSPFAAGLLAQRAPALEVRSSGLHAAPGRPAEAAATRAAAAFGVDLAGHAARTMDAADAAWADLVLGMEGHHVAAVRAAWPEARRKTLLLGDFLPGPPYGIEDPWGRDDAFFAETFERIRLATERLAARLAGAAR